MPRRNYATTGSGKSRQAPAITDTAYVWGPEQGRWFDGYFGESDIIFETFLGTILYFLTFVVFPDLGFEIPAYFLIVLACA